MMNCKEIDVIAVVVTYNRKELLPECLRALELQTYPVYRIIIVDNCSTDGTTEWLKSLNTDRYDIVIMPENVGGAGGFGRGIQEACKYSCEYILVLDDDCILNANYIEELLCGRQKYIAEKDASVISALCGVVYENGEVATNHRGYMVRHRFLNILDYWRECDESEYIREYFKCDIASFCGLMISRNAIAKIGYPKKEYFIKCDDTEYSLRLGTVGKLLGISTATLNHKVSNKLSENGLDWKDYYYIRNSVDLAITYKLPIYIFKVCLKFFWDALSHKQLMLWKDAIADGMRRRLEKNEEYSI